MKVNDVINEIHNLDKLYEDLNKLYKLISDNSTLTTSVRQLEIDAKLSGSLPQMLSDCAKIILRQRARYNKVLSDTEVDVD